MSEIKDRQDAASDIDPIVAALADGMANDTANDIWAAAAVEGFDQAAEPLDAEAEPVAVEAELPHSDAAEPPATELAATDELVESEPAAAEPVADAVADFGDEAPAEAIASADIADAIEAAPLDEAPQLLATNAFEHMPAAYADTIVELDVAADSGDDEAPLLDVDLEDGIASVFAALHAAQQDHAPVEPLGDLEAADGVTFRLLGELDRLWHRAA
ncbi:hypothetical protein VW23_001835 [Devosia insulae DS-56]|uniref:Uncharacterized protein n=1 Tax=Devosia insulae DS-56 TaxID=1116389 RepID=A0A1E5XM39_9HYPH|nr:hypothetical protein [Devosia insulae]OEO29657.1 hypothetical protein VW23_001835 [Devosia insulae DS-56]